MNYPARMSTLAVAGLPMIQRNNAMHTVATQKLTRELGLGLFYSTYDELAERLNDKDYMMKLSENCWKNRLHFSFDYHIADLLTFFYQVIEKKKNDIF
ncbi:MAG: glycosyl transferase [Mucilaginibacter sp.]|nr:glycosyl transferase [Mucilaginibacter sp.]